MELICGVRVLRKANATQQARYKQRQTASACDRWKFHFWFSLGNFCLAARLIRKEGKGDVFSDGYDLSRFPVIAVLRKKGTR
jgi:hypothetical protein